jgi:hypothetical protein
LENSWYVKRNNKHHFFCRCGNHDVFEEQREEEMFEIIDFKREELEELNLSYIYYPDNRCTQCTNEHYLDMKELLYADRTRFWSDVEYAYEKRMDDVSWSINAYMTIPHFIDESDEITHKRVVLSTLKVSKGGFDFYEEHNEYFFKKIMIKGTHYRFSRILETTLFSKLPKFILNNPVKGMEWLKGEVETIEGIQFFLKYPNLKFRDIFFWKNREHFYQQITEYQEIMVFLDFFLNHRQEKSLRKIQFESYHQMMNLSGYNPMVDYIFSRTIKDRNHLLKILQMEIEIKTVLFDNCNIQDIIYFLDFLHHHYKEKHITQLFLSIKKEDLKHRLLNDTIELFHIEDTRNELTEKFQKTPLKIKAIHDELVQHKIQITQLKRKDEVYSYPNFMVESQVVKGDIEYRLPLNNQELYLWGKQLHNCLFMLSSHIMSEQSTVFGLFVDNKLTYAIEIKNHKIIQASSSHNRTLDKTTQAKIDRWYKDIYMVKSMVWRKVS